MTDIKVSGLPVDSALDGNHYVPLNDPVGPTTKRTLLSTLATFLFNQVNIPDGSGSPRTRAVDLQYDFVASGLVWSGDAYGSTRNASMTAGVVYINGRRITITAVSARAFTASRDTYIDVLDNGDGTGTLVYTEGTNNSASQALAANSIRIGIIVTGAANIANVGSVNQGQEDKILPIASSIAYSVTDSLGNLICGRDSSRRTIGMKRITSTVTTSSGAQNTITGLSMPVIVPTGRKVELELYSPLHSTSGASGNGISIFITESGTDLTRAQNTTAGSNFSYNMIAKSVISPSAGLHTYIAQQNSGAGTVAANASSTFPVYLIAKLV